MRKPRQAQPARRGARTVMPRRALVAAVGLLSGACGSASFPAGPNQTGAPVSPAATSAAGDQRTSEPYWVAVATFNGDGIGSTGLFAISPGALQWRVTYRCVSPSFSVVAVSGSGQALSHPVVDAGTCATTNQGYATPPGGFHLRITASGAWNLVIEQQLDVPLLQPPPALATATLVASSTVYPVDAAGEGVAKLYRLHDGSYLIRLDNFYTTANSDLTVRLSPLQRPTTTAQIAASPFAEVAPLAATVGSMNYPVPSGVAVATYHSLVIWCQRTTNAYAAAAL